MSGNFVEHDFTVASPAGGSEIDAPSLEGICWPTLLSELRKPVLGAACVMAVALGVEHLPDGFQQTSMIVTGSTSQGESAHAPDPVQAERERLEREAHWRMVVDLAMRKQRDEIEADAEAEERLVKAARGRPVPAPNSSGRGRAAH